MTRGYPAVSVETSARGRADNKNESLSFIEFLSINRGRNYKSKHYADQKFKSLQESCRHSYLCHQSWEPHLFLSSQNLFPPARSPAARRTMGSKVSQANSDLPVGSGEDRHASVETFVACNASSSCLRVRKATARIARNESTGR